MCGYTVITVEPVVAPDEDARPILPWCQIWENEGHPDYPVLRMSPLAPGEALRFHGFTDIEVVTGTSVDAYGRRLDGVVADGIIGHGAYDYLEIIRDNSVETRPVLAGAAALGLNSGSPVLDTGNRIVGVVSKSPTSEDGDGYTEIALFASPDDVHPPTGGRHRTGLKLSCHVGDHEDTIGVLCDFG
jgi:hypothetical protein